MPIFNYLTRPSLFSTGALVSVLASIDFSTLPILVVRAIALPVARCRAAVLHPAGALQFPRGTCFEYRLVSTAG